MIFYDHMIPHISNIFLNREPTMLMLNSNSCNRAWPRKDIPDTGRFKSEQVRMREKPLNGMVPIQSCIDSIKTDGTLIKLLFLLMPVSSSNTKKKQTFELDTFRPKLV